MHRPSPTSAILAALLALGAPLSAADGHAGHDHGKPEAIGAVDISGHRIAVSASGGVTAGAEWHVELRLTPDQPAPKAVRIWVGTENGRGSAKARASTANDAKGGYSAHVELPDPIPAGSRLWISLDPESGQTAKGSIALPQAAAGHHDGDGHRH